MNQDYTRTGPTLPEPGFFGKIATFALLFNVIGLFAFTQIAICSLGLLVVGIVIVVRVKHPTMDGFGAFCMLSAMYLNVISGAAVGFGWLPFRLTALVVLGAYALALTVIFFADAIKFFTWLFNIALFATLASVVLFSPTPPGTKDEREETKIIVVVTQEDGTPVPGARIYVQWRYEWEDDPIVETDGRVDLKKSDYTDEDSSLTNVLGIATFEVKERTLAKYASVLVLPAGDEQYHPAHQKLHLVFAGRTRTTRVSLTAAGE
jgi:hypothetical protein